MAARHAGVVPGERHTFSAGQELRLYDRDTLYEVLRRRLDLAEGRAITFSGDGSRYALLRDPAGPGEEVRRLVGPGTRRVVSVHDTMSGEVLLAAPAPGSPYLGMALDAKGRRVVVSSGDGRLRLRTVPHTDR